MGRLRHRTVPGATYFVTTKSWQNRPLFRVAEVAQIVVEKMLAYRSQGAFQLHEFVVMPDHLHLLLIPSNSTTLEKALQLIKGGSSHGIHISRLHKMQLWQPGFHESRVTDALDYKRKADYIRFNPVAAKLTDRPEDWTYSSASRKYLLDPIPQGLKPPISQLQNVGPKGPTPNLSFKAANS